MNSNKVNLEMATNCQSELVLLCSFHWGCFTYFSNITNEYYERPHVEFLLLVIRTDGDMWTSSNKKNVVSLLCIILWCYNRHTICDLRLVAIEFSSVLCGFHRKLITCAEYAMLITGNRETPSPSMRFCHTGSIYHAAPCLIYRLIHCYNIPTILCLLDASDLPSA